MLIFADAGIYEKKDPWLLVLRTGSVQYLVHIQNQRMKFIALTLLFLITGYCVVAQQKVTGSIKGKIVDSINNLPLPDATITLITKEDSANVGFAVADKAGFFEIKNIPTGSFIIGISFTGYAPHNRHVSITAARPVIDLETVLMNTDTAMMASVIVTAPPITIKKDTVEFRASAFKTKPNATVEDLLKKLPGVEVDKDGNVTSQGESIPKIYVDGKEFFGNDPKLATKNLTAEMVESIQVFDDMSDQAKFTRIDDGSRQRTINIKLKKDRRKGLFGRSTVGGGSSERYLGNLSMNMFNDDQRISIVGSANNVNQQGFSATDVISTMGGMAGGGGGRGGGGGSRGGGGGGNPTGSAGNGNTKTWSAGVNYRDDWGKKMDFSGNYFVSNTSTINRSRSVRQNLFANDSTSLSNENSFSRNDNLNHRFGFRWEYEIDSMSSILLTPNINVQHSESESVDSSITTSNTPKSSYKAIEGASARSNQRDGVSFNNNLLFRHRFHKPGRTFTIGWTTAVNDSEGDGLNTSPYSYYNADGSLNKIIDQRQRNDQVTGSFNNTVSTSLTEMFDKDKILELNYAYTFNHNTSDRDVYDYNSLTGEYDSVNKPQTNYFVNDQLSSRLGTNFRVKKTKYDFQLGGAVQMTTLKNMSTRALTGKDSSMSQRFTNFFPNASFNYNMGTRKSIRFGYRGSTRAPSITQLQDVVDQSNQLVYRTGNPNLKQEFTNNFNFSFNTFNVSNFMFFNTNINATVVSNKIVSSQDSISKTTQLIKPVNLNGAWNLSFSGTIGIPLIKVTTGRRSPMNLNLTTSLRYGKDVSQQYKKVGYNTTLGLGQRIRFDYNIQDKLDVGVSANFNYNDAQYQLQANANNRYLNHNYSLDVTYTFFKRFMLSSDMDYYVNSGRAAGFNQPIPLWNSSIAWVMFKKRNGELRFSVMDLLNQNKNIDRTITSFYIEDTFTETLRRYFLVTFMYNLNRFGGRNQGGQNRNGGGGGGQRFNGGGGGGNRGGRQ
jgi:uncharacterized membrane protein YgcG